MKVYLVTDGDYSDYRVVGVYSSAQLAERAKELYNASNDIDVRTLDILDSRVPEGYLCYRVWEPDQNGVFKADQRSADYFMFENNWNYWNTSGFQVDVIALSEDHAVKIGSEKINILKATHNIDWSNAEAVKKLRKDLPTI